MAESFYHSVCVDEARCNGCIVCVKICPTAALRVRAGKAEIVSSRCIDCGECIRHCPTHALTVKMDTLRDLRDYKYNVALPAPSLYAQFNPTVHRETIWEGLKDLGFDEIFDLSAASDYISQEIENYVAHYTEGPRPLISSSCPAMLRLIQIQFPELIRQVIPILAPSEAGAIYVRRKVTREQKLTDDEVGVWFITPCPAKGTNIRQEVNVKQTKLDGSISINSILGILMQRVFAKGDRPVRRGEITTGSSYGMRWGSKGGEIRAAGIGNAMSVHGVRQVQDVLEQISMNKLPDIDYIECYMCAEGCVGGPLASENCYVARKNLQKRVERLRQGEVADRHAAMAQAMTCRDFPTSGQYVKPLEPRPTAQLDDDIEVAMAKMEQLEAIIGRLPGLNCGACGAPTCQCLAEDIVRGDSEETDCIYILRERVTKFVQGMVELSEQIPLTKGR